MALDSLLLPFLDQTPEVASKTAPINISSSKKKNRGKPHGKNFQNSCKSIELINVRFRLVGVPPDKAVRFIQCQSDFTFAEIGELVHIEYKLCPTLNIGFVFRGRPLAPQQTLADVCYCSNEAPITIFGGCAGG